MNKILLITSSLNAEQGNSSQLASQFVGELCSAHEVKKLDLNALSLPHLSADEMQAWMTPEAERTDKQVQLANLSDGLIKDINDHDLIVIGMPMYNFGVPSVFKAWIDRIARAGVTFKYTEQGPVGLVNNKKIIVVAARGGMYAGTAKDTQTTYLKDFFGFLGITDVAFIYAEGLAMPDKDQRWSAAKQDILTMAEKVTLVH
ncbi:FMN-dependent NADH-azoreductase [Thalassotalea litorea]|uniref:FMN-dependent NADH-azoreductase n=1 Tax=Thalassotalea litorea TaxID=2020715 RepID=UPI003736A0B0